VRIPSRESLRIEGRDIEPRSTPTVSRLYEIVLQSYTYPHTELLLAQVRLAKERVYGRNSIKKLGDYYHMTIEVPIADVVG
jgi:hypothetical protein